MNSEKRLPLLSSFTAKIFFLLLLVGSVPVVASSVLFEKISGFNQDLQIEAQNSINDVSDVYKAWASGVKSSHNAMRVLIRSEVELIMKVNGVKTVDDFLTNETFKAQLQSAFERRLKENERLFEIDLKVNQEPYLNIKSNADTTNVTTDSMFAIVLMPEESFPKPQMMQRPEESEETLDATEDDEEIVAAGDAAAALPSSMPAHEERKRLFNSAVELTIVVGYDSEITAAFEKLGERQSLHSSVAAMENGENTQLSALYQRFFFMMCALVSIICIIAAFFIAYPFSRRISRLAIATEKVANGELDTHVEIEGNDQIAYLARQFNDMTTELKAAQDNQAYIERMKAWQEVARKLAHEIKNPLTPMLLAMQQLDKKFDDYIDNPKKYRRLLDDVMEIMNEESATLQKLVKEFSSFARLPVPERHPMRFYDFVRQTVLQNPQFEEQTKRCTVHEASEDIQAREVSIDKELMRRVVVNIIKNGIEAATNAKIEPEIDVEILEKNNEKSGKHDVWLMIVDNGPGLTAEQKEKIFNPYFTTKSDGTGLGLVIVRKIVQDHDGEISLHDRDDGQRGTQVDIIFKA